MNVNDPLLLSELRRDEGVRTMPYKDSEGILTVGVGHNLEAHPMHDMGYPMSDTQINQLLAEDLVDVFEDLDRSLPWWQELSQARQRVLANMAFNLGLPRLQGFKKMLEAIRRSHFEQASAEMLDSKWARQVGGRATRLAKMMING